MESNSFNSDPGRRQSPEGARWTIGKEATKEVGTFVKDFDINFPGVKARYVEVDSISRKVCPLRHLGAGQNSWIFVDEIVVK